jgi:3-dehydroquinate synthase
MMLTQRIQCSYEYPIYFTRDIFSRENTVLNDIAGRGSGAFFVDSGIVHTRPSIVADIERWIDLHCLHGRSSVTVVEGGEQCKNNLMLIHRVSQVIHRIAHNRSSYVVIAGGGAVLDAVGFTASITHSGIRQIKVPTTVLSQNYSGCGGRNAVNYSGIKNFFATFSPPLAVINDFDFLSTLSQRDWIAGVAEAFKVGIFTNRPLLDFLTANAALFLNRDVPAMEHLIVECARLHADNISRGIDSAESEDAWNPDLCHWCAHWLEIRTSYQLRHGEALAVAIALELKLAENRGQIDSRFGGTVIAAMRAAGLEVWHSALLHHDLIERLGLLQELERFPSCDEVEQAVQNMRQDMQCCG